MAITSSPHTGVSFISRTPTCFSQQPAKTSPSAASKQGSRKELLWNVPGCPVLPNKAFLQEEPFRPSLTSWNFIRVWLIWQKEKYPTPSHFQPSCPPEQGVGAGGRKNINFIFLEHRFTKRPTLCQGLQVVPSPTHTSWWPWEPFLWLTISCPPFDKNKKLKKKLNKQQMRPIWWECWNY